MSEGLTRTDGRRNYLADGVYAEYDGFGFWLCTMSSVYPGALEKKVYIDPETWGILKKYVSQLEGKQWQG